MQTPGRMLTASCPDVFPGSQRCSRTFEHFQVCEEEMPISPNNESCCHLTYSVFYKALKQGLSKSLSEQSLHPLPLCPVS